jgi:hypothetical protein
VTVTLGRGEPAAGPWRIEPLHGFVEQLAKTVPAPIGRPRVVAIDGRSGSGKTTLARRLVEAVPGAALVETDDISWYVSRFDWDAMLRDGVLEPLRDGLGVHFRLPDSPVHGVMGHINVPEGASWVFVEGVGSARRSLSDLLDAVVWVQSDAVEADRRGILRNGGDARAAAGWADWMAEELPFLAADRPWERAVVIVDGTPALEYDPATQLVVAPPLPGAA